ncbi:MAG TPA: hypothetical protein VIL00_10775 [Pseudonocardiaceae bacterium]
MSRVRYRPGCAFALFPVVLGFLMLGLVLHSTVGTEKLGTDVPAGQRWQEAHTWAGGLLGLEPTARAERCWITPENGEERVVELTPESRWRDGRYLSPWFSGSAAVACDGPVNVSTGVTAHLRRLVDDERTGFALVGVIWLCLLSWAVWAWRHRRRTRRRPPAPPSPFPSLPAGVVVSPYPDVHPVSTRVTKVLLWALVVALLVLVAAVLRMRGELGV